jgi:hypothetical protein
MLEEPVPRRAFCAGILAIAGNFLLPEHAQLVRRKSRYDFDVKTFGALGTGLGDDTHAFVAALQAAARAGGIVRVPRGRYPLSQTLDLKSGVSIVGEGDASALLWRGSPRYGITATAVHDVAVRLLQLAGPFSFGVLFDRTLNGELTDCSVSGGVIPLPGAGYCGGAFVLEANHSLVARNTFAGNGAAAPARGSDIQCNGELGRSSDIRLLSNRCTSNLVTYNICCFDTAATTIQENHVAGAKVAPGDNSGYGIAIYQTVKNPGACHDNAVIGNTVERTEGTGIYFVRDTNSRIERNMIRGVGSRQSDGTLPVAGIALNDTTNVRVSENTVTGSGRAGISVVAWEVLDTRANVTHNTVSQCEGNGIELRGAVQGAVVSDNTVSDGNGGIANRFAKNQSDISITANRVSRMKGASPGIALAGVAKAQIVGNKISDFGGYAIDVTFVDDKSKVDSNEISAWREPHGDLVKPIRVRTP